MSAKAGQGAPPPQGDYVAAKRHGSLIFTSGMTPRRDGVLQMSGTVSAAAPLETWRDAVILATGNALLAARSVLAQGETIGSVLSLTVYIAAEPGFTAHAKLADYASGFLRTELGENGIGTRAAVGVATLPGGAPVEVQLIAAVQTG
jgi:enamine deaminase RidA (YjgF/YER057c/UK114 family)